MNELQRNIWNAKKICDGEIVNIPSENPCTNFSKIYPFTNENINGYIDNFILNNKSLLTVGSSGDQAINAIYRGCEDITLLDINPFTKYYYFLKVAALTSLDIDEYMKFLRFNNYASFGRTNYNAFNMRIFKKISDTLINMSYESYCFWQELFSQIPSNDVREDLFSMDENKTDVIIKCNPYLANEESYLETRKKVQKIIPSFLLGDLFLTDINKHYDNIWLSSIGPFLKSRELLLKMVSKMAELLNNDGLLLISYLYQINKYTIYDCEWDTIYNLNKTFKLLEKYNPELVSFLGINGIIKNDSDIEDSILLYRKRP